MPDALHQLIALALAGRVAKIAYVKATEIPQPRLVEAYALELGRYESLLRCYQLSPEEGWRSFKPSKIRAAEDSGESFKPRRKLSFDGEIRGTQFHPKTTPTLEFSSLLSDCLADLHLSGAEIIELRRFQEESRLKQFQIDDVCLDLYSCAVRHCAEDGVVTPEEKAYLARYRDLLKAAGWNER